MGTERQTGKGQRMPLSHPSSHSSSRQPPALTASPAAVGAGTQGPGGGSVLMLRRELAGTSKGGQTHKCPFP